MNKTNISNTKKVMAVFMAVLMMILSLLYTGNKTDAANTTRRYYVYNAQTGTYKRWYDLDPVPSAKSRTIVDGEDRYESWYQEEQNKKETPGVVKIITSKGTFGSGFVIDDHTIATAAHCVYNHFSSTSKPQIISEVLLFDTNGNITLEATPVEYHVPYIYTNQLNDLYDYALITVKEDLSEYKKFNLGVPLDSCVEKETSVILTGFPEKFRGKIVNTVTKHMMYSGEGIIVKGYNSSEGTNSLKIAFTADATEGNSGGPVYVTESLNGETYYTVIGILTQGSVNSNLATRITTDLIHFYSGNNENLNWK